MDVAPWEIGWIRLEICGAKKTKYVWGGCGQGGEEMDRNMLKEWILAAGK